MNMGDKMDKIIDDGYERNMAYIAAIKGKTPPKAKRVIKCIMAVAAPAACLGLVLASWAAAVAIIGVSIVLALAARS